MEAVFYITGQRDVDACPPNPLKVETNLPVKAVNGSNITLLCITNVSISDEHILEWKKDDLDILIVKENFEKHEDKSRMRLAASIEGLKKGNASLRIDHVMMSDEGTYCCCIKLGNKYLHCVNQSLGKNPKHHINTNLFCFFLLISVQFGAI